MKKDLSVRRLLVDSLDFIGKNAALLMCWTFLSFAGSYAAARFGAYRHPFLFFVYAVYIYFFYFFFISIYNGEKPYISKQKFVDSLLKMVSVLALSLSVLICGKLGITVLHRLCRGLVGFPQIYDFIRQIYYFLLFNSWAKIIIFFGIISLLTFTFFIPGFAWVGTIGGKDASIISAYAKVQGNYLRVLAVFLLIYGILPLVAGFVGLGTGMAVLSLFNGLVTVFQVIVYLHLYDVFYQPSLR